MPDPFNIRPEQPGDEVAIQRLVSRAFPSDAEATLIDNLRASRRLVLSLVAVDGDEIIGHVSFSPVSLNGREIGWGMAPVSTLPERQREGIASKLIEAGLDRADRGGVGCAVVLGSPAFYGRFGFLDEATTTRNDGVQLSYGLGWGVLKTPHGRAFFKGGHDNGWENYMIGFDKSGAGLVLMTNSSNGDSIFKELLATLIGDTYTPWEWQDFIPWNAVTRP